MLLSNPDESLLLYLPVLLLIALLAVHDGGGGFLVFLCYEEPGCLSDGCIIYGLCNHRLLQYLVWHWGGRGKGRVCALGGLQRFMEDSLEVYLERDILYLIDDITGKIHLLLSMITIYDTQMPTFDEYTLIVGAPLHMESRSVSSGLPQQPLVVRCLLTLTPSLKLCRRLSTS